MPLGSLRTLSPPFHELGRPVEEHAKDERIRTHGTLLHNSRRGEDHAVVVKLPYTRVSSRRAPPDAAGARPGARGETMRGALRGARGRTMRSGSTIRRARYDAPFAAGRSGSPPHSVHDPS